MPLLLKAILLLAVTPGAAAESKRPQPKVIRLRQADLSDPALREAASRLGAVFQLFVDNRAARKPWTGVSPRGEPHLVASCSGSHLGNGWLVTARHCVREAAGPPVWRRYRFRIEAGRLVRNGQEDLAVDPRPVSSIGDLVAFRLARPAPGLPALSWPESAFSYPAGAPFLALGYPNDAVGEPAVAVDCSLRSDGDLARADEYGADCRLEGGMSGGPQLLVGTAEQIGINSADGGERIPGQTSSPRLTALPR